MPIDSFAESIYSDAALDRCRAYIVAQLKDSADTPPAARRHVPGPAVTVARQTGCGSQVVVERLAALLQDDHPDFPARWTVFDRQLIEKVLAEHHLPTVLARFIPEDRRSYLTETVADVLGLQPATWRLVPDIVDTILHLVELGHVIVVGRGCSVITARTPNVYHVRLVAPRDQRIEHVCDVNRMTRAEAERYVDKEDRGRERYMKTYFKARIDDPLLYHTVINTGRMSYDEAAQVIADGARRLFARNQPARAMAVGG
jgi:hypothetical protein